MSDRRRAGALDNQISTQRPSQKPLIHASIALSLQFNRECASYVQFSQDWIFNNQCCIVVNPIYLPIDNLPEPFCIQEPRIATLCSNPNLSESIELNTFLEAKVFVLRLNNLGVEHSLTSHRSTSIKRYLQEGMPTNVCHLYWGKKLLD